MAGDNGDKEIEHPKPLIEVLSNSREAIEGYAQASELPLAEAALVLIFNELRCIHWHYDAALAKEEELASQREG
ncbi:unnamed protein product [marine sediment metagenome]|uniref:Uncharacterized protein n=1 Tax=marine sediment metagenome TaxID=412755 RepID=X1TFD8_9ZZZZ